MNRGIPASALVALSLCGALQACRRSPDPQQVAAADRLLRRVDSLQRTMDATDTLALTHLEGLFAAERTYIEARFQDTLDAGTATALGNYHRAMAQALPHALDERRRLRRRQADGSPDEGLPGRRVRRVRKLHARAERDLPEVQHVREHDGV